MSSESPPRDSWETLLSDKDVIVLTKATFFRTVNLLFHFAESPERCTWEFFHYRGYEYILGTWCATFNIEGFAISCGAQHPLIYRLKKGLHYALPDYVLLSHRRNANGEQEDHLILVVEIKSLGKVDPDTQVGRKTAERIFQKTWPQRVNQARLAFLSHPSQHAVNIVMASGPWFALYAFERSQLMREKAPDERYSMHNSPPKKRRKRGAFYGLLWAIALWTSTNLLDPATRALHRARAQTTNEKAARSAEVQQVAGDTRGARRQDDTTESPVVNHVFQLGPSGERDALNPWFLQMLGQMKDKLETSLGKLKTQNSWFDWPTKVTPTGDGHAEGFTLPTGAPVADIENIDVGHIIRLDDDPVIVGGARVPSTPGNARETVNMLELNALLSPSMHRTARTFRGDIDIPSTHSHFGIGQPPSADSDSAPGTDDDTTPKGQRDRQPQGASDFPPRDRELSPSAAYLERRQHGPVDPSQSHSAPRDSSPPHLTPHKQLFGPFTADEGDSEFLTAGFYSEPVGPEPIPRPASAPPAPSSPPSRTSQHTPAAHSVSRGPEPPSRANDRPHPERVIRPMPSARSTARYQPLGPFKKGALLVRPPTQKTNDRDLASIQRTTATPEEWTRRPPTADELLMHALRGDRGPDGVRDYVQGYRRAGMNQEQAIRARDEYVRHIGPSSTQGRRKDPSVASGSRSTTVTATVAVPPVTSHRPAMHASSSTGGGGPTRRTPSGFTTAPSAEQAANRAGSSRPPPVEGVSVARTASLDGGNSEPLVVDDLSDDEVQVSMLAERLRNLSVTDGPPGTARNRTWDNPSQGTLLAFAEVARKARTDLRTVLRNVGMDERQVENAHAVYTSQVHGKMTIMDLLIAFLAEDDGAATMRMGVSLGAQRSVEGQRGVTARSDAPPQPGPSRIRGAPARQTNPAPALPDPSQPGPLRAAASTSRKGKEKQG